MSSLQLDVPPLSEAWGWGVMVGFGVIMTVLTMAITQLDAKLNHTKKTAEQLYSAGRNNTSGLTASVIVSQWTWAATILESANSAWKYGVAGPFWYAAGSTIHIMLFAILAIEVKRKAPNMHTLTEFMLVRHGRFAHVVFLFFALLANVLITAMVVLAGASTINALTGLRKEVCMVVIPLSVLFYTTSGGLKATFFACYLNALFIFVVTLYFAMATYFSSGEIGSADRMFDLLLQATALPVDQENNNSYPPDEAGTRTIEGLGFARGNHGGSYLTLTSSGALIFGAINIVGNFGIVFVDQSYWQSAIGASSHATVAGFLLAGISWFSIPFSLATAIGLTCRALQFGITVEQADQGLVATATAAAYLGDTGAILLLVLIFLATTATGSGELISVSSLITYDIFMEYLPPGIELREKLRMTSKVGWDVANNGLPYPKRLDRQNRALQKYLLRVVTIITVTFAMVMGLAAFFLDRLGVNLSWLYGSTGVWLGSPVIPIAISFFWAKANGYWCSMGAIIGLLLGLITWVSYAYFHPDYRAVTLDSLNDKYGLLAANIVSLATGGIVAIVGSHFQPDQFRWQVTIDGIKRTDEDEADLLLENKTDVDELKFLRNEAHRSRKQGLVWIVIMFGVPLIVYACKYNFSRFLFEQWVTVSIGSTLIGAYIAIILPLVQEFRERALKKKAAKKQKMAPQESRLSYSANRKSEENK